MRFLPLALGLVLILSGCLSSGAGSPPRSSSVLDWGIVGLSDVPTLDPALASDATSISVASLVYGGLVRLDGSLHVRPDGARSWTISRDGLVYTFHLRRDLRFPDGRRVTARDFAGALNRALGAESASGTAPFYLGLITHHSSIVRGETRTTRGITVVDPTTLRITLVHPAAHFLSELAFPASYVPDLALVRRYGPAWTDHAAGFGPYYVQAWRHSRYLTLARNPYYYGGKPALPRITLHFYQGPAGALADYRRGSLSLISGMQAGQSFSAQVPGVHRIPALALDYLAFNTQRLPFHRLSVRRAFAATWSPALDRRSMGATAFPSASFLPSAFGISVPPRRLTRSPAAYLARGGYRLGESFPAVALVIPQDPYLKRLGRALQRIWRRELNLDIRLRTLNPQNYGAALDARTFDIALVRWGGDYPDPQDFLGTQLGSSASNVTGWSGASYNDKILLADTYNPADPRRPKIFYHAAADAAGHVPFVPLDEPALFAVIRPGLQSVQITPLGTIYGNWSRVRFAS